MSKTSQTRLSPAQFKPALKKIFIGPKITETQKKSIEKKAKQYDLEIVNSRPDRDADYRNQKSILILENNKKKFIKRWKSPGSIVGNDEWCLQPVEGCSMDCCYCYLQNYLQDQTVRVNLNVAAMLTQLEDFFANKKTGGRPDFSLGELSDGLYLEPLLDLIPELWNFFNNRRARLEIRTKSHHIHSLLEKIVPQENSVFCWTLTPGETARKIELFASSLEQRLAAMKLMLNAGFKVGIRMDPIILKEGWAEKYQQLIATIKKRLDLNKIAYLVAGTFRFPAGFDRIMQNRFPNRNFLRDEMQPGPDGKYRYPRRRRVEAYRKINNFLSGSDLKLNLCMEPEYIWEDAGLE